MENLRLCNGQCWADGLFDMATAFNAVIPPDSVSVINIKHCMMVVLVE